MGYIKGYTFETKEIADSTMDLLNGFFGLPAPNGSSYYSETSYELIGDIYFIHWDEVLTQVLGEPDEINI